MPLCTINEIEDFLSLEGAVESSNDLAGGDQADGTRVDNAIERAEQKLKQYIVGRYDTTYLTSNVWAKWACALIAAVELFRRRGNAISAGLKESYDELIAHLELVREGIAEIPDGVLRAEPGMVMSNLRFDARYFTQHMRAQSAISAGQQQSAKSRRTDIYDMTNFNW